MSSKFQGLFLVAIVLLTILTLLNTQPSIIPIVQASEQNFQDRTVSILHEVMGIDTAKYRSTFNSQMEDEYVNLPQTRTDISIESNAGSLRASCCFVNGRLRQLFLSDCHGQLALKQPIAATASIAENFLDNYQEYSGDSFYGKLSTMLVNADPTRNSTKTSGNIRLEIRNSENTIVDYVWTYIDDNGVVAPVKNVILSYDQGELNVFADNWSFYKVVNAPIISADRATEIAIEASKSFSYEVTDGNTERTITGFNISQKSLGYASLSYINFKNESLARSDPFTLYPSWFVPLGFDKIYPGDVTGMTVTVWADTGKVSSMGISNGGAYPMPESAISPAHAMLTIPITIAIIFAITISLSSKRICAMSGIRKKFYSRSFAIVLCCIIIPSCILVTAPTVNAGVANSKAEVYAALYGDVDQVVQECDAAREVCNATDTMFREAGYTSSNNLGPGTTEANVVANIQYDESNYDQVAVFHFGHLIQQQRAYQGNNDGDYVNDTDIYPYTSQCKHKFVFIWVCSQAVTPQPESLPGAPRMPVAWTHRDNIGGRTLMSSDGYSQSDSEDQCYIGFSGASPIISAYHQTFRDQPWIDTPLKNFIMSFYNYALLTPRSVKTALNAASLDFFGYTFTSCVLQHFWTYWPPDGEHNDVWYESSMKVFGNANIMLYQPYLTVSARDNYNNQLYPRITIDGQPFEGTVRVAAGSHTFETITLQDYTFVRWYFDYGDSTHTVYGSLQTTQSIPSDCVLTLYYDYTPQPPPPPELTVLAIDNYGQPGNVPLYIDSQYVGTTGYSYSVSEGNHTIAVASPIYSGGQLHVWVAYYYDGNYYYDNPITVDVAEDKTVYALYWTYW